MARRYSSVSVQTTLAVGISNNALSATVSTGTAAALLGGISLAAGNADQFKIIIDPDTLSAEVVYVTGVTSDTLTIVRGRDGTSGIAHISGAIVKHVVTGEDLTYFATGVAPVSNLAAGVAFPGSTSGTATLKAAAVAGTTVQTLPTVTGTLMSAESVDAATSKTTPVDADELPLADSAASFGLKKLTWANLKATLGPTLISTTALTSGVTAPFNSIPQIYRHLKLIIRGVVPNTADRLAITLGGGNHSYMAQYVIGSAPTVLANYASVGAGATSALLSFSSIRATNAAHEIIIDFPDYANTVSAKTIRWFAHYLQSGNYEENVEGTASTDQVAALTTFTLKWNNGTSTFGAGTAELYGVN